MLNKNYCEISGVCTLLEEESKIKSKLKEGEANYDHSTVIADNWRDTHMTQGQETLICPPWTLLCLQVPFKKKDKIS